MSQLSATLELPAALARTLVSVGDRFEFAGGLGQFEGPTSVEVTALSVTGMVAVRLGSRATKFDHYASIPLERVGLLITSGAWVPLSEGVNAS